MTESETSSIEPEPLDENFYIGQGTFDLPNGDSYVGEFVAHRNGLVWREGKYILIMILTLTPNSNISSKKE